jgi:hypothetical protein
MAAPVPPHGFLPQVVNPGVGGGGGAPPLVDAPQLPFGADPGSITGLMLQAGVFCGYHQVVYIDCDVPVGITVEPFLRIQMSGSDLEGSKPIRW